MVVKFRRRTLLPLDDVRRSSWNDVLGCLRDSIPKLTRSSLHRCLERHSISRLPENPNKASKRGTFVDTKIGYVPIDISELRLAPGKLNMFLAINRVSKFTPVHRLRRGPRRRRQDERGQVPPRRRRRIPLCH